MTTTRSITPDWKGLTVAVLASGPSMSQAVADDLARYKRIVVNYTFVLAPAADMLVALDADRQLWSDAADFPGVRVCGVDCEDIDALYTGPRYERIELAPGHVIETRNSGLAAIRIAGEMGAARIILAGFDPDVTSHFEGRPHIANEPDPGRYAGLKEGLEAAITQLRAAGVVVEHYTAPKARKTRGASLESEA